MLQWFDPPKSGENMSEAIILPCGIHSVNTLIFSIHVSQPYVNDGKQ